MLNICPVHRKRPKSATAICETKHNMEMWDICCSWVSNLPNSSSTCQCITNLNEKYVLETYIRNFYFAWISLGILFCFRCKSLSRNGDPSPPISSSTMFWGFSSKSTSLPFSWSASSTAESMSGSLSISWNKMHIFYTIHHLCTSLTTVTTFPSIGKITVFWNTSKSVFFVPKCE